MCVIYNFRNDVCVDAELLKFTKGGRIVPCANILRNKNKKDKARMGVCIYYKQLF